MLQRIARRLRAGDDAGSTIVVVLVVMLVLTIGGLAVASVVTATTGMLVGARSTTQSRAAADAGISDAVASARRTGSFCSMSLTGTNPVYSVTSACAGGQVTFTATGTGGTGGTTTTQAVYTYASTPNTGGAAELVFFNSAGNSVYFTSHVMPQSASNLATILFPGGGLFQCKTTVPGNVITMGSIQGQSGCTINGSVYVGGASPASGYALYLNNSDQVLGSASVVGNTLVAGGSGGKIAGTLTVPSTASVGSGWGTTLKSPSSTSPYINGGAPGGIIWSPTLGQPVMAPWFDYTASSLATDWPGYQIVTLTASSSPYNCSNWKGKFTTFWTSFVTGLTQNTVVDGRGCPGGMDTAQGANATATLGVNLVFLANQYTLGNLSLAPKSGTTPSAWFVVPDTVADGKPTCPPADANGNYGITTNASISVTVNSEMYTPCSITDGNGGTWTGAMYAGNFVDGGNITIYTSKMALPGQWGTGPGGSAGGWPGSSSLGTIVSRRDI